MSIDELLDQLVAVHKDYEDELRAAVARLNRRAADGNVPPGEAPELEAIVNAIRNNRTDLVTRLDAVGGC